MQVEVYPPTLPEN